MLLEDTQAVQETSWDIGKPWINYGTHSEKENETLDCRHGQKEVSGSALDQETLLITSNGQRCDLIPGQKTSCP